MNLVKKYVHTIGGKDFLKTNVLLGGVYRPALRSVTSRVGV